MRSFLNVAADILTLLALVIAGIGHMLPWLDARYPYDTPVRIAEPPKLPPNLDWGAQDRLRQEHQAKLNRARDDRDRERAVEYMSFQAWHAIRSGIALGVMTVLVCLSLAFSWGPLMRRILVLLMFGCALAALVFETLIFTQYPITEEHARLAGNLRADGGFITAVVGTSLAAFFSLIRMLWTMTSVRPRAEPPPLTQPVPVARPNPEAHGPAFGVQRERLP